MTTLVRLYEKGRLERQRDGRAFAYRPVQSREQYTAVRMGRVLSDTDHRPAALARFVEGLPASDRVQLRRLLGHSAHERGDSASRRVSAGRVARCSPVGLCGAVARPVAAALAGRGFVTCSYTM